MRSVQALRKFQVKDLIVLVLAAAPCLAWSRHFIYSDRGGELYPSEQEGPRSYYIYDVRNGLSGLTRSVTGVAPKRGSGPRRAWDLLVLRRTGALRGPHKLASKSARR
jgi:hypothetical protein